MSEGLLDEKEPKGYSQQINRIKQIDIADISFIRSISCEGFLTRPPLPRQSI